jgi:LysR family hca operon transcriptional activator
VELRHLRYFVAVAEEQSFLSAARRLRIAQPALSKQIRDLERDLGVVLLERHARGTRLTRTGRAFFLEARSVLESAARAAAAARRTADHSRLHFAYGELLVYAPVVAQLLGVFRRTHPDAAIEIHRLSEAEQRLALREHRVDVVATFVSSWPVAGFGAHRLVDCPLTGVLLPANHRLAAKKTIRLPELLQMTWLHAPKERWPESYRVIETALLTRGLDPVHRRERSLDAFSANVEIAAGHAWALANPALAVPYVTATDAIVYRPFREVPIPASVALLWRQDSASQLLQSLLKVARRRLAVEKRPRKF